jgi:hypothetical protein
VAVEDIVDLLRMMVLRVRESVVVGEFAGDSVRVNVPRLSQARTLAVTHERKALGLATGVR